MSAQRFKPRSAETRDSLPDPDIHESSSESRLVHRVSRSKRFLFNCVALILGVAMSFAMAESFLRICPDVGLTASERRELRWRRNHKSAEDLLTQESHSYDQYSPD